MIAQTRAILLDAYRELNSKKLFWIVLILNVLVMAAFGLLGANGGTLSFLWWDIVKDVPAVFIYKYLYSNLVVGFWFTWLAVLLALISTAGMFPDFLSAGAVDLYLAKPISRVRLFFTKYLAGLLFVTLQVTLFTLVSFLVLGFRAHLWEPGLFAAIPLVVLLFSYLYAFCVLFGVWTRSTIAALLLTLLVWFGIFAIDFVDRQIQAFEPEQRMRQEMWADMAADFDDQIAHERAATQPNENKIRDLTVNRDQFARLRDDSRVPDFLPRIRSIAFIVKTFVPKTRETTSLLDRVLFTDKDLKDISKQEPQTRPAAAPGRPPRGRRGDPSKGLAIQSEVDRQRSPIWIIGTSLLFEAAILALAARSFCKRDY